MITKTFEFLQCVQFWLTHLFHFDESALGFQDFPGQTQATGPILLGHDIQALCAKFFCALVHITSESSPSSESTT